MILSKTCNYALRAVLYVAKSPGKKFVPIKEIADYLGVSFYFLTKILQILTQRGILQSFKGPHGGVALARPAAEISLMAIIEAIDGPELVHDCFLGLEQCSENFPCPIHDRWRPVREQLQALLSETSLQQLADKMRDRRIRLTDRDMVRR